MPANCLFTVRAKQLSLSREKHAFQAKLLSALVCIGDVCVLNLNPAVDRFTGFRLKRPNLGRGWRTTGRVCKTGGGGRHGQPAGQAVRRVYAAVVCDRGYNLPMKERCVLIEQISCSPERVKQRIRSGKSWTDYRNPYFLRLRDAITPIKPIPISKRLLGSGTELTLTKRPGICS